MIAKIILTLGLLTIFFYAFVQARASSALRVVVYGLVALGTYLVWFPDHSMVVAHWIGIGRGADVVLYLWVILTFLVLLNLHLKIHALTDNLTQIARHLALSSPEPPDEPRDGG